MVRVGSIDGGWKEAFFAEEGSSRMKPSFRIVPRRDLTSEGGKGTDHVNIHLGPPLPSPPFFYIVETEPPAEPLLAANDGKKSTYCTPYGELRTLHTIDAIALSISDLSKE